MKQAVVLLALGAATLAGALDVSPRLASPGLPPRGLTEVERPPRLPVWPVSLGITYTVMDLLTQRPELSFELERRLGGRVAPIQPRSSAGPFPLLACHRHSFTLDPVRFLSSLLLPEGFPAHPHSGFCTLTMAFKGGMVHRDSEGVRQAYADGDVQWMSPGNSVTIHEEMWDLKGGLWKDVELYQLWVLLPRRPRLPPSVRVVRDGDLPRVPLGPGVEARVLMGALGGVESPLVQDCEVDVGVYDVRAEPGADISFSAPYNSACHAYVRRGSVTDGVDDAKGGDFITFDTERRDVGGARLPPPSAHESPPSAVAEGPGAAVGVGDAAPQALRAGPAGAELLLLAGRPVGGYAQRGPFIAPTEGRLRDVETAFYALGRGAFWDHRLGDEAWRRHCGELRLQERWRGLIEEGD